MTKKSENRRSARFPRVVLTTALTCACTNHPLGTLRDLAGQAVVIDLMTGACEVAGVVIEAPLHIAADLSAWFRETVERERERVPVGLVSKATTTLTSSLQPRALAIDCQTVVEATVGTHASRDTARWAPGDFAER
jgi:hypothetical protein